MANLNAIVKIINDSLKTNAFNDKRFEKLKAFGITKSLPTGKDPNYEYLPVELNNDGDGDIVTPDDLNVIQVYHKMNAVQWNVLKAQYGNANSYIARTASMSMIVFAQRKKAKLSEDMLDLYIQSAMPSAISLTDLQRLKLKDCIITPLSTDFNSLMIWKREYNSTKYYLKPEHLFFEVKYSIECRMHKSCINTNTEC